MRMESYQREKSLRCEQEQQIHKIKKGQRS